MNDLHYSSADQPTPQPEAPRWLDLSDAALLADCRFDAFRGSGPGGQKRNKTSSAIRLTHLPTKIHVVAGESRSQVENKQRAIRRLKLKLAIDRRQTIDPRGFAPPDWLAQAVQLGRIAVSSHHPHYARLAALVLDLLAARDGAVGDVAALLGVTTSSVVKFLGGEAHLWTAANQIRSAARLSPLEKRT